MNDIWNRTGKFIDGAARRPWLLLAGLAAVGMAVRAWYVYSTASAPPHLDLGSFTPSHLSFTHPFDTSPREPLFVWWLWLLSKAGISSTAAIRLATSLWFVPSLFLLFSLVRRLAGAAAAWGTVLLFAFLPGQVQFDTVGLRHLFEIFGLLLLLDSLSGDPGLGTRRGWLRSASALVILVLTRVNYAGSGLLLLAAGALKSRRARPLLAILPALLLLTGHLRNNQVRHGDPLYSVRLHTYYISNMEYLGTPGFPQTVEEWQKDPYKPRLTMMQWVFERHTPWEIARASATGLSRGFWDFYEKVFFALGMPAWGKALMLALYIAGFAAALARPAMRLLPLWMLLLTLPYAFVSHVFWAGRYFAPFAPLALALSAYGGVLVGRFAAGKFRGT